MFPWRIWKQLCKVRYIDILACIGVTRVYVYPYTHNPTWTIYVESGCRSTALIQADPIDPINLRYLPESPTSLRLWPLVISSTSMGLDVHPPVDPIYIELTRWKCVHDKLVSHGTRRYDRELAPSMVIAGSSFLCKSVNQ